MNFLHSHIWNFFLFVICVIYAYPDSFFSKATEATSVEDKILSFNYGKNWTKGRTGRWNRKERPIRSSSSYCRMPSLHSDQNIVWKYMKRVKQSGLMAQCCLNFYCSSDFTSIRTSPRALGMPFEFLRNCYP